MPAEIENTDVLIIGGGPAGSTAALVLARAGVRVILLEKARFPRFHIGESFIPHNFSLIKKIGLEAPLRKLPHVPKFGAQFVMGDGSHPISFEFSDGLNPTTEAFNLARAEFDEMLLNEARSAGADTRQEWAVREILQLRDGDVRVRTDRGEIRARWLIDASGQGAIVARHLGTRRPATEKYLHKTAYFQHFEHVRRPAGREAGHPLIVMMDEGWFWMIPLDDRLTSVGMVIDPEISRQVQRSEGVPADRMLAWGIARCPAVRDRMIEASGPETNIIAADFSYRCRPYAGEGYFLVGDAAAFLDPIFSTGVCMAMSTADAAARLVIDLLAGRIAPKHARREHNRFVEGSTRALFRVIGQYYDHSFRELFLSGVGPFQMHRAVIGILAGNVFPRPPWALRWRLGLFNVCVRLNRHFPLVARCGRFSIRDGQLADESARNEKQFVS